MGMCGLPALAKGLPFVRALGSGWGRNSRHRSWILENRLEFLLALARERHFGRAADSCGVSQQTLSASLKQLERQSGVLLVRRGRGSKG